MVIIFPVVVMPTKMDVAADDDIDNYEDESNDAGENECDTAAIDYNAAVHPDWSSRILLWRRPTSSPPPLVILSLFQCQLSMVIMMVQFATKWHICL